MNRINVTGHTGPKEAVDTSSFIQQLRSIVGAGKSARNERQASAATGRRWPLEHWGVVVSFFDLRPDRIRPSFVMRTSLFDIGCRRNQRGVV